MVVFDLKTEILYVFYIRCVKVLIETWFPKICQCKHLNLGVFFILLNLEQHFSDGFALFMAMDMATEIFKTKLGRNQGSWS